VKRRTLNAQLKLPQWPNMRADTLKAIAGELVRARKSHPARGKHLKLMLSYADELTRNMIDHNDPGGKLGSATQIYALAMTVAAMAIRVMEEGDVDYRYKGNVKLPDFELEP